MKNTPMLLLLAMIIAGSYSSYAQPGSLDLSFGNNGIVIYPVTPEGEQIYRVAMQPDGKIVVAGFAEIGGDQDFLLVRFNSDGSPDNGFGTDGVVTYNSGSASDVASDLSIRDDGAIYIGGSVFNQTTTYDDYAVARFNSDGTPDNTFGSGGFVSIDIDEGWDNAYAMITQPDGKILLAGEGYSNNKRNVCIVRLNENGTLDEDFGATGITQLSIGTVEDRTRALDLQSDGKILVSGFFSNGNDQQAFLARFNSDGTADNAFAINGVAMLDIGGHDDKYGAMAIRPDGKIVVAGQTVENNDWNYLLVRYNTDGTTDNTFGDNGITQTNFSINDITSDMVLQDNGKILVAGGAFHFELLRFNEDGYPDLSFGDNGLVTTNVGTGYSFSQSLVLQEDNKILVAGQTNTGSAYDAAVARYHSEDNGSIPDADDPISSLEVYPNPVDQEEIHIYYHAKGDQIVSIALVGSDGRYIIELLGSARRNTGLHHESLLLPGNLTNGLYFIRVLSNHSNASTKVLVSRH